MAKVFRLAWSYIFIPCLGNGGKTPKRSDTFERATREILSVAVKWCHV